MLSILKTTSSLRCKFIISLFVMASLQLLGQQTDPFQIAELLKTEKSENVSLFSSSNKNSLLKNSGTDTLLLHRVALNALLENYHPLIKINLPSAYTSSKDFYFTEYNFFAEDYAVKLLNEEGAQTLYPKQGLHLKGIAQPGTDGFASLSLFEGSIYGSTITTSSGWTSILPIIGENSASLRCIMTPEDPSQQSTAVSACNTDDFRDFIGNEINITSRLGDNCKIVEISVHVDYDLYLKFNKDVQLISNYVTGLFNNVHTLYKREGISIALKEILIHNTEDNFTHISASADLENFKKKYINTNKTVQLLLSGYSKNGTAPLGGIAYINTVCLPTYSYAYANVYGNYSQTPAYSWDVFVATHELGHTFGSRHTHACVWGLNKNQAIDQCAKLEGSCASPGIPKKGTLMSYCYATGMPGIDLLLGFGKEPGDLIRATLKNASCLKSSTPEGKALTASNTVITANVECFDGVYAHYYFDNNTIDGSDDVLLISIKKDTQNVGFLQDSTLSIQLVTTPSYGKSVSTLVTSPNLPTQGTFNAGNKYWIINSKYTLKAPINIQYLLTAADFADLKGNDSQFDTSTVQMVQVEAPGNIDPRTQWKGATQDHVFIFSQSKVPTQGKYFITKLPNGHFLLELNTSHLASTGFGTTSPASNSFVKFGSLSAQSDASKTQFSIQTTEEIACKHLVIEKQNAMNGFDSIGIIIAKGNTPGNYSLNISVPSIAQDQFRIKAKSTNGSISYSTEFFATVYANPATEINVYPNPVPVSGALYFEYANPTNVNERIIARISDVYGKILRTYYFSSKPGNNVFQMSTNGLKAGLHQLSIQTNTKLLKANFTVGQ